jgi:hypothetical protein
MAAHVLQSSRHRVLNLNVCVVWDSAHRYVKYNSNLFVIPILVLMAVNVFSKQISIHMNVSVLQVIINYFLRFPYN